MNQINEDAQHSQQKNDERCHPKLLFTTLLLLQFNLFCLGLFTHHTLESLLTFLFFLILINLRIISFCDFIRSITFSKSFYFFFNNNRSCCLWFHILLQSFKQLLQPQFFSIGFTRFLHRLFHLCLRLLILLTDILHTLRRGDEHINASKCVLRLFHLFRFGNLNQLLNLYRLFFLHRKLRKYENLFLLSFRLYDFCVLRAFCANLLTFCENFFAFRATAQYLHHTILCRESQFLISRDDETLACGHIHTFPFTDFHQFERAQSLDLDDFSCLQCLYNRVKKSLGESVCHLLRHTRLPSQRVSDALE